MNIGKYTFLVHDLFRISHLFSEVFARMGLDIGDFSSIGLVRPYLLTMEWTSHKLVKLDIGLNLPCLAAFRRSFPRVS